MRLVIECIERIGVAQDILSLLAKQSINLEGIELEKQAEKGLIYLRTEAIEQQHQAELLRQIKKIPSVITVQALHHLPQERKNLELQALIEALPNPVLSLDIHGKIAFANSQACKLLLPIYRATLPKKKQHIATLEAVPLNEVIVNLNRTKWYPSVLQQGLNVQNDTRQPISHPIQFHDQVWRMDVLPLELWEAGQNRLLGYVVNLQSQQAMQLDLRQFMANQNSDFDHIIGNSPKMRAVIEQAKKFATLNAPLLIQGETGTGKDLFAKACHQFSFRRDQKFIAVNCAGLPAEEAESEMFGHRRNGQESIGFFEYANGGTVLLDGIAELSLEMQAKLLRFLNDGSFRRVGEDKEIHVDVRVICTSQQPLATLVAEGKVRQDLFHRLNVLTLNLPPLRERQGDLPLLVAQFVAQISQQLGIAPPYYDEAFINALQGYQWVGNLRELYNAIYRACSLATNQLSVQDLDLPQAMAIEAEISHLENATLDELVNRFEASLLRKFYAEYPSTRKLAQRLGISHTAVANKLRIYGIGK
ncbi:sigma-54-dependent transcriptional regulator [Muribacter muris]|uniref:HTH-type transcriptional regulatory protein TyrR n=2 Tax=Muribacter muris TaxID=67855 RepID=A0A4Y9JSP6_9PAST|nr:sigma-54-dependent transcriptional regulator [Muribacter muris]MBF0828341.1 sigma-54-dependent transcriptional regulator [Muribacter muris]TFV08843.1 sigma-54-dependent transcriptional regulator [Muribacter muris]